MELEQAEIRKQVGPPIQVAAFSRSDQVRVADRSGEGVRIRAQVYRMSRAEALIYPDSMAAAGRHAGSMEAPPQVLQVEAAPLEARLADAAPAAGRRAASAAPLPLSRAAPGPRPAQPEDRLRAAQCRSRLAISRALRRVGDMARSHLLMASKNGACPATGTLTHQPRRARMAILRRPRPQ